jgi:hypothetical protein
VKIKELLFLTALYASSLGFWMLLWYLVSAFVFHANYHPVLASIVWFVLFVPAMLFMAGASKANEAEERLYDEYVNKQNTNN